MVSWCRSFSSFCRRMLRGQVERGRGRWGIGNTWPEKHQLHKSGTLNPFICVLHVTAGSLPPRAQGQLENLLFFFFLSFLSLFDKLPYIQLSWGRKKRNLKNTICFSVQLHIKSVCCQYCNLTLSHWPFNTSDDAGLAQTNKHHRKQNNEVADKNM